MLSERLCDCACVFVAQPCQRCNTAKWRLRGRICDARRGAAPRANGRGAEADPQIQARTRARWSASRDGSRPSYLIQEILF